jgi:hypothetical protein
MDAPIGEFVSEKIGNPNRHTDQSEGDDEAIAQEYRFDNVH